MLIFPKSRRLRRFRRRGGKAGATKPRPEARGSSTLNSERRDVEPEFRASEILAMVIAGLQVVLPYFFIILAAIVGTYLLVAAFFRMA